MRAVVFAAENVAEMPPAVDRTVLNRRLADHAARLRDRLRAALQEAGRDSRDDEKPAQYERLFQHRRSEKVDERRLLVRLLEHVEDDHEQDDPEAEAQESR